MSSKAADQPLDQIVWNEAHRSVPNYNALYDYVVARAGEGDEVSRKDLGLTDSYHFTFGTILVLRASDYLLVYSIDRETSQLDVELIS